MRSRRKRPRRLCRCCSLRRGKRSTLPRPAQLRRQCRSTRILSSTRSRRTLRKTSSNSTGPLRPTRNISNTLAGRSATYRQARTPLCPSTNLTPPQARRCLTTSLRNRPLRRCTTRLILRFSARKKRTAMRLSSSNNSCRVDQSDPRGRCGSRAEWGWEDRSRLKVRKIHGVSVRRAPPPDHRSRLS